MVRRLGLRGAVLSLSLSLILLSCDHSVDPELQKDNNEAWTTGETALPGLSVVATTATDTTWLDDAFRAEIYQLLTNHRRLSPQIQYPALISVRKPSSKGYRYRTRALPRNKALEADAGGNPMLYVYGRQDPASGELDLLVAALIPASAEAVRYMNAWVNAGRRGPLSLTPPQKPQMGAGLIAQSSTECTYSEQLVFYADECGCWGYELLEVCAGDGGGDWPPPDDPGYPWHPDPPWNPGGPGGGGDPGGGNGGNECDPTMIDQPPHCQDPDTGPTCGDERDTLIQEYESFPVTLSPRCSDFTRTARSQYFSHAELTRNNTHAWAIIRSPLTVPASSGYGLDRWRQLYGAPRNTNSVYRCPHRNALVSGASQSRHMFGDAVDMRVESRSQAEAIELREAAVLAGANFHYIGIGHDGNPGWVHADWRYK